MRVVFGAKVGRSFFLLCVMLVLSQFYVSYANSEQVNTQEVKIAIISNRNHSYKECIDRWAPTAAYLTQEILNYSFTIIPLTPAQFESAIDNQTVDFVISCPSLYVKLEVLYGATRIATMKIRYAQGSYDVFAAVFLCRSDRNDITDFKDLKDKRIRGLHGPYCTTWNIACLEFLRHGLNPDEDFKEVKFSITPSEIVQAVQSGNVDVGIIRSDLYDRMKVGAEINPDEFRILHENDESHSDVLFDHSTAVFPERLFAKLRYTSDELTKGVTVALLKMPPRDIAAEAARCNGWTIPHNYQPFHDALKMLRISPYEHFGNVTLGTILAEYRPWIISILLLILVIVATLGFTLLQTRRLHRAKQMILEQQIVETSDRTQQTLGEVIHGTLGQQLTAIRLLGETLKDQTTKAGLGGKFTKSIGKILVIAREATRNSRQIASDLYPVVLSRQGLCSAVESYLSAMNSTFGILYKTRFPEGFSSADFKVSLHLYRIIQESVHNAIKHGQAGQVFVAIEENMGSYILTIEDNGKGFNPDNTNHDGLGLHIMKYRANAIGGDLIITSSRTYGTRVTCNFNLSKSLHSNDRKPINAIGGEPKCDES